MQTNNNKKTSLTPEQLYHACDVSSLKFKTTEDLDTVVESIGQPRALDALKFGIGIQHDGYNLYVSGSTGLGKHTMVKRLLDTRVADTPVPSDWCYVNNFEHYHKPIAMKLPAGYANKLRDNMEQLIDDLLIAIPAAFEGDEYTARVQEVNEELNEREESVFAKINEEAGKKNIVLMRTPGGYTIGPMRDGKIMSPEKFEELPEAEKEAIRKETTEIEVEIKEALRNIPIWTRETRRKIKELNREISQMTVDQFIADLQNTYHDYPQVLSFLDAVNGDIVDNVDTVRKHAASELPIEENAQLSDLITQYQVNVLVDNSSIKGAPVIYEDNPTHNNLMGRIEHVSQFGTLLTNFTLIKPGAIHRANGGYLVLDVRKILLSPFAWEGLKRTLLAHEIRIESVEQMFSLVSTISLEPEPIPIDIKVVLTGDRLLYYLLKEYDPEFNQLFKVAADFAEDFDRSTESTQLYAKWIASLQREHELKPIDTEGVGRIIEECARKAEDSEKLSLHMGNLLDLLREADYWAAEQNHSFVTREDVQKAIDMRIKRLDQIRERMLEQVLRDIYLLETEGTKVAQVNALTVIQLGDYAFGRPTRVTATARLGSGKVIDIEREVKLGGAIHSKGVLILSSYLAGRYAQEQPLSLSASLVFEQSYGQVEGDSASIAELCALLSALANLPLAQSMAITGSVNQLGQIQAIGGVNEKIEGFFDICKARGLSSDQGVIIPHANIKHLMLRKDVVDAVKHNQFHIYAIKTVDQAMEILTGLDAGALDDEGKYPPTSINGMIMTRLEELTSKRRQFSESSKDAGNDTRHE